MRVFLNFIKGFKMVSHTVRLVIFLFIFNLIFSLILAIPMYHSLQDSIGDSLVGEQMTQGFDYLWWEEFRDQAQGLEKSFTPAIIGKGALLVNLEGLIQIRFLSFPTQILIFAFIYLLIHTFFAGGILNIYQSQMPTFTLSSFFSGAGKYFFRFLGIMLVSWIFFFGIIGFLREWFNAIIQGAALNAFSEILPFFLGLSLNVIILLLFLFFHMIFDYVRIKTVFENQKNIFQATASAFGFVFQNLGTALGLYFLIFLVNVAGSMLYLLLKGLIPQTGFMGIFLVFVLQQAFIFTVIWIRCWLYSSQMELFKYIK